MGRQNACNSTTNLSFLCEYNTCRWWWWWFSQHLSAPSLCTQMESNVLLGHYSIMYPNWEYLVFLSLLHKVSEAFSAPDWHWENPGFPPACTHTHRRTRHVRSHITFVPHFVKCKIIVWLEFVFALQSPGAVLIQWAVVKCHLSCMVIPQQSPGGARWSHCARSLSHSGAGPTDSNGVEQVLIQRHQVVSLHIAWAVSSSLYACMPEFVYNYVHHICICVGKMALWPYTYLWC